MAEDAANREDEAWPESVPQQGPPTEMDDKDVLRLQDRIDASEERGRLRLDASMARIDGKLDTVSTLLQEITKQSSMQATESAARYRDLSTIVAGQASESAARYRDLRNTVIATGLVVLFGIAAILIGLKQVWIGGVQVGVPVGQAIQASTPTSSAPTPPSQTPSGVPSAPVAATPAKPGGSPAAPSK